MTTTTPIDIEFDDHSHAVVQLVARRIPGIQENSEKAEQLNRQKALAEFMHSRGIYGRGPSNRCQDPQHCEAENLDLKPCA